MKYTFLVLTILAIIILASVATVTQVNRATVKLTPVPTAPNPSSSLVATPSVEPSISVSPFPSAMITTPLTSNQSIFYPMTNYDQRITNRWYGKSITAADSEPLACGDPFTGYHTGDDLEVTDGELSQPTPVFAIAEGTIRQVGTVSGYGGLITIEHQLNGERVTAYYGHIDTNSTTLKIGDQTQAGQRIANLGMNCSGQTSNERKHLHFAIRKGTGLDVRGYVVTESELNAWLNPRQTLQGVSAQSPQ